MAYMTTISIELPSLYGDHHVVEVRRLLLEMPGVKEVYASSCFHVVDVGFDSELVDEEKIRQKLEEAGYFNEFSMPKETDVSAYQKTGQPAFFRHSAVYENTRTVVSFSQKVLNESTGNGRPLWTCPGMGVINMKKLLEKMEE
jgi:copper chaperone CopZ